ncbi:MULTISPECIES: helix-turn-helix domain-containing protein [Lactobacillus]|uniref:helix-turn-helix domain-containing protein n=1 Tax=Lactobacillus TaxID=1578 RepID=UPI00069D89C2|nr:MULTISPECIES: helix-turn-helix transcriptional regulator [Lactobacillus]OEH66159.1 hypothetical protein BFX48_02215 [Lactobacillus jensenii]
MNNDKRNLALIFKRIKLGLSQAELAEKLNVSPALISQIESGKRNPSYKMMVKFSEFFNESVDSLFFTKNSYK